MNQIALMMLLASAAWGQLVTITGPFKNADGTAYAGTATIQNFGMTCGGYTIPANVRTVTITAGEPSVALQLYATTSCNVATPYYSVRYRATSSGAVSNAFWQIPASPTTTAVDAIQWQTAPLMTMPFSRLTGITGSASSSVVLFGDGAWRAIAESHVAGLVADLAGKQALIGSYTVATLPAHGAINALVVVTDAATAGSCTVGGGTALSLCRDSGSAWVPVGDGGGGGGGGIFTSIFGRITPDLVATAGDYNTDQVPELPGTLRQYFTAARAVSAMSGLYATPADVAAKVSTSTVGQASGVAGLNSSGYVPPAQLGSGTASSATCLYGDMVFRPCGTPVAGYAISVVGSTISGDTATMMSHSTTAGVPSFASVAGSEIIIDSLSGFPYLSNGTTTPYLMYRAGIPIQQADIPAPGVSGKGGILTTACTSTDFVKGYDNTGAPVCSTPAGSGSGAVDSVNGAAGAVALTTGTTGTAPAWVGTALNIPAASGAGVTAGTISKTEYDALNAKQEPIGTYTVSTLPAGQPSGALAVVSDASTAGSCTVGGGSALSLCRFNGGAWVSVGDGGGAGSADIGMVWSTGRAGANIASGTTYVAPFSNVYSASGEYRWRSPVACTLQHMTAALGAALAGSNSAVITLRVGGSDTAMTCTIDSSSSPTNYLECADTTHTVSVAADQLVSWKVVASTALTPAVINALCK